MSIESPPSFPGVGGGLVLVPRVLQLAPQLPRPTRGLGGRVRGSLATDHLKRVKVWCEGCVNVQKYG